jgi:hypothetical protein
VGGGCTQAGQGQFASLYHERRETFLYWAWMEQLVQKAIGHDYTILKDERGGTTKRLALRDFVERIKIGDYRPMDFGACACFGNVETLEEMGKPKPIQMQLLELDKVT